MPVKGTIYPVCINHTVLTVTHIPFYMSQRSKILRAVYISREKAKTSNEVHPLPPTTRTFSIWGVPVSKAHKLVNEKCRESAILSSCHSRGFYGVSFVTTNIPFYQMETRCYCACFFCTLSHILTHPSTLAHSPPFLWVPLFPLQSRNLTTSVNKGFKGTISYHLLKYEH